MSVDKSIDQEVLIQVEDLRKAFGENEVLTGITTEIKKGEVVVIIGPSGSGKSTFLRSLNLLERHICSRVDAKRDPSDDH